MSEVRDNNRLLEILAYSKRPYFQGVGQYDASEFDSIIVIEDAVFTELTSSFDDDVLVDANLTGLTLPMGTVITWQDSFKSITLSSGLVQLNRKFAV